MWGKVVFYPWVTYASLKRPSWQSCLCSGVRKRSAAWQDELRSQMLLLSFAIVVHKQPTAIWIGKKKWWNSNVNWIGGQRHENVVKFPESQNVLLIFFLHCLKGSTPYRLPSICGFNPACCSLQPPWGLSPPHLVATVREQRGSFLLSMWVQNLRTAFATRQVYLQSCSVGILFAALA